MRRYPADWHRGFNPPPAFRQGGTTSGFDTRPGEGVSIRPPPFGKGELVENGLTLPAKEFQSAPRLSARGNITLLL